MANAPGSRDYNDLQRLGDKPKDAPARNEDRRWWDVDGAACAKRIRATLGHLERAQSARTRAIVGYARLYTDSTAYSSMGPAAATLRERARSRERSSYSAIQSIIDTLMSRVGETKPRPYFLTSGGNYRQQRKAKKLNQLTEGIFYEAKTYDIGIECFRDAAVTGDAFMHVFPNYQTGKVDMERVSSSEMWVDEIEAQYGKPREMRRVKSVDRDQLIGWVESAFHGEKHKERREALINEIEACDRADTGKYTGQDDTSDMVKVAECWRLGIQGKDGKCKDGWHAICLVDRDVMLVEPEKWEFDFFPFARLSWAKRPFGYWSQGVCERRASEQAELNKQLGFIQTAMQRASKLWVFIANDSKVATEQINNDIGTVIRGNTEPKWYCPEPIHPIYIENVGRIIERMEREEGLSQTAIAGKKEPGINSGTAIRSLEEQASDRFRALQRTNDNFYLDVARLCVHAALELGSLRVRVPGKTTFDEIDLKGDLANVKADEFVLQCYPVSRLPREPSGRLQTIQEFIQAGWINPRHGKRLMDFPDLDAEENLSTAQEELVMKVLDAVVDDGEFSPPEPTDDLELCKEMVLWYISRYRLLELEEERLNMLRDYNAQVDALQELAMAQMHAELPQVPQGVPSRAPQSELLPQAA